MMDDGGILKYVDFAASANLCERRLSRERDV